MIQDIYPHKLHNEYHPTVKIQENSTVLNIYNGKILVHAGKFANHIIYFPTKKDLPERQEYTYLFKVDDKAYFLLKEELPESLIPAGYTYIDERSMRQKRQWTL